jgi:stage II sporulation protein AA (anti-sigma F factor antagonist)
MEMTISHKEVGKSLLVRLSGELDLVAAEEFRNLVDDRIDLGKANNLYVNLEHATFLDSSFLGALLGRFKRIKGIGGQMGLIRPAGQIRPSLEVSGILRTIGEYQSEPEALSAMGDS